MKTDIRTLSNLETIHAFEAEATFAERVSARGIYDVFVESAKKYGERTALTMIMTGEEQESPVRVTYHELLEKITRTAQLFISLAGACPGVAFMLPNLIETHLTLWGAESAGYAVPINYLLRPKDIANLVEASGAKILVTLGPHPQLDIWEKALAVKKLLPNIILIRVGSQPTGSEVTSINFEEGIGEQTGESYGVGKPGRDDEVAAYFHTGGTTGTPKLVAHTHRNQLVAGFGGGTLLGLGEKDVFTNGLPLFHVGGCIVSGLTVLMFGGNVLVLSPLGMRNPNMVKRYWKIVERYGATILANVPTALSAVLDVAVDADLSSVRMGLVGGAASPPVLMERFFQCTGKPLHEIYGMTESAGLISVVPAGMRPVPGSVGLRLPYTEISVRNIDVNEQTGQICAPHKVGVLIVSGPNVSPGYRDASSNSGVFENSFLNSGDLAYMDEEGRLFIAGRAKDLIIRSGHNVDPAVIEEAVSSHPAISLAAAVGQPDPYAGELPVCYVTLKPGASISSNILMEFVEPKISERPAWPKQIYIVDSMPVTGVGKIFKPALRCDAAKRLVTERLLQLLHPQCFSVDVTLGGKRGMEVSVSLDETAQDLTSSVAAALDGYLFTYVIKMR